LNGLCWEYATANVQLERALKDCEASLALTRAAATLDSRGFVLLRLKRYSESIASYDAAISAGPASPASFYGRGLARLRKGEAGIGQADLAHARSMAPGVDLEFAGYGLTP
jgi:tetratricopeptide (TPR) repeat protein